MGEDCELAIRTIDTLKIALEQQNWPFDLDRRNRSE